MFMTIDGTSATITGPFARGFIAVAAKLTGKKEWGDITLTFEASAANVRLVRDKYPDIKIADPGDLLSEVKRLDAIAQQFTDVDTGDFRHSSERLAADPKSIVRSFPNAQPAKPLEKVRSEYKPKVKPWKHQEEAFRISAERPEYALLWEMGTGKTAMVLRTIGHLHLADKLSGVVIVAPKGVQRQWIEDQIPEHFSDDIKLTPFIWEKGKMPKPDTSFFKTKTGLSILAIHIDALRVRLNTRGEVVSKSPAYDDVEKFLHAHRGRSMMVVDESHLIKGFASQRTEACVRLGRKATFRRICTGTPIARDLLDMWSQFNFLNPHILGHEYYTSFRSEYCIMGGFNGKEIIAHKNIEQFYAMIAPHAYRTTKKECLDLPEKQFVPVVFELSDEQMTHYSTMKREFMAMIDDGEIVDVESALVQMLRLQQITCGFLPRADGTLWHTASNARMETLLNSMKQINGQTIIWSRFTENIESVAEELEKTGRKVALYYGGQSDKVNRAALKDYLAGKYDDLSANPQSGGTGIDGLQKVCQHAFYYSNSFRLLDRLQSEDRTHRSGMGDSMTYFDLIAHRTIDRMIINNLRGKKDLADLTLDTIRMALAA